MSWERGRIYYGLLPDVPDEERTLLVVSSDVVNEFMSPVVVQVTRTDRVRTIDTWVELAAGEGGLPHRSYALCHEIATLDDETLDTDPLGGRISARKIVEVNRALALALDLPSSWPIAE